MNHTVLGNKGAAAAALAGLFLVLTVVAMFAHSSAGFVIELREKPVSSRSCGAFKPIVIHISADGSVQINHEVVAERELGDRISFIYSTRADGVLYLSADSQVEFQRLAEILNTANQAATNLHVRLLNPAVQQDACLDPVMPWLLGHD